MSLTITIPGAVNVTTGATAPATLTVGVGVPGATGPAGPGVPAGGTAGQFLQKIDGVSYNTDWVTLNLSSYAPLASPALTGTPTAPTATTGDSSTQIATTAFVQDAVIAGSAHAETLQATVRNNTGATLAPFTVVYINGALGNQATVAKAQANAESTSAGTFAVTQASIANNANGVVISAGVLSNVDTSAYADGDKLYLSPTTAGGVTTTKPSAPNHLVYVGVVTRSHPTLGTVSVRIQNGYELGEIHDVALTSVTDNDLLAYNASTGLWNNESFSTLGLLTSATAASTYQTQAGMSSYLTTASAASTYYLQTNPAGYITSSALSTYAPLASPALTGVPTSTTAAADTNTTQIATTAFVVGQASSSSPLIDGTATIGTSLKYARADHVHPTDTTRAALSGATFTGLVNTAASTTAGAGFRLPHGTAPTTPTDGDLWTTTGNLWVRISGASQAVALQGSSAQLSSNNIFTNASSTYGNSTAAGTINLGTGATISGATKAINIGNNGAAGSTTSIVIGQASGTSSTNIYGTVTLQGTAAATTLAADTNTTGIATTAFVVGQAGSATPLVDGTAAVGTSLRYARQDHVHPTDTSRAALASPTFTGTPAAPTAAADTNTTQIATTAFVVGQASATSPAMDGTATIGTSLKYARADHIHPTDTSRAPLASPTFTGTPAAPTATAGTNTTQLATTAFVQSALPVMATETQAIYGTSSTTTISPLLMRYILANPMLTTYNSLVGNYSSFVSGSGAISAVWSNLFGVQITAANGKAAFQPNSQVSYHSIQSRGKAELIVDWTKPMWFSFRFCYSAAGTIGDSNTVNRVTIGKVSSTFGDLSAAGFGVKWTAGTAGAFTVMAHNGTTLSTSASAVTVSNTTYFPTTSSAADFMVYSDGTGNVTLYCNNVQVATTTGGPSSGTSPGPRFVFECDNTTSTSGTVTCDYSGVKSMLAY